MQTFPTICVAILLALTCVTANDNPIQWNNLRVKYVLPFSSDGYYELPLDAEERSSDWTLFGAHEDFPQANIYCFKKDPRVCPFYDQFGKIAGLRVAFIIKDLKNNVKPGETFPFLYEEKPMYKSWDAFGEKLYAMDALFLVPETLLQGGLPERTERLGTDLFLRMDGKNWIKIPRKEMLVEVSTPFTKQACFPGMGMHYWYNMSTTLRCEDHQPPFLLYDRGQLIGLGLTGFGAFDHNYGAKHWLEDPPTSILAKTAIHRPPCLLEWVEKYGSISLHIFFKRHPRTTCWWSPLLWLVPSWLY